MKTQEVSRAGQISVGDTSRFALKMPPDYTECFCRWRLRAYSSMRRSYSRYVDAFTSSRRLIFSKMRLPNPCRINFRMPIFLTNWLSETLGCIIGSRGARLALRVQLDRDILGKTFPLARK